MRAVKHHMQYLSQLKAKVEGRGLSLVSDTGMGSIMKAILVGCVEVENPDCASRTHSRELAECPRNTGNVWACREHVRVGPVWGLSREDAAAFPAPPEVTRTHTHAHTHTTPHTTHTHAHTHTPHHTYTPHIRTRTHTHTYHAHHTHTTSNASWG